MIYLVRHAVAVGRKSWEGPDARRPLSPKGGRQAEGLVDLLGTEPVRRVLSSPARRCIATVEPLAAKLGLQIRETDDLAEGARVDRALALVRAEAVAPGGSVLCTHGDVIPDVLGALRRHGLRLPGDARWAKGSTWVLSFDAGDHRVSAAHYLPPPG